MLSYPFDIGYLEQASFLTLFHYLFTIPWAQEEAYASGTVIWYKGSVMLIPDGQRVASRNRGTIITIHRVREK